MRKRRNQEETERTEVCRDLGAEEDEEENEDEEEEGEHSH
jgi:hypothetical protein